AAADAPAPTDKRPDAVLHFFRAEPTLTGQAPVAHEYVGSLICGPDSGDHPRAKEACTAIRQASGHLDRIPRREGTCTLEYRPVPMEVFGVWKGTPVHHARTFGNPCLVGVEAAGVFDF
ncbi:SSI family serine proteinase inhibitor, partial [Nocardiopsis rhodophaea]